MFSSCEEKMLDAGLSSVRGILWVLVFQFDPGESVQLFSRVS